MVEVLFWAAAAAFVLPVIWMNTYERIAAKNLIFFFVPGVISGTVLAALSYHFYGLTFLHSLKLLFVYIWLFYIAYIDFKKRKIPNPWICYGVIAWAVFFVIEGIVDAQWLSLLGRAISGLALGGGVFLTGAVISKGGIGMGDVKMYMVIGMFTGWQRVFSLMLVAFCGVLTYSLVMIVLGKLNRKSMLPIGPFTYMAGVVVIILNL